MSKAEPTIQKYMTCQPNAAESSDTVQSAQKLMADLGIRHLPVMESGEVVGVISDRDIKMALSFSESNPKLLLVKDICHDHPYTVSPDAPLGEVVLHMAEKRYGCAIVVQNQKLVGIFTTVDVCRALASVLETRFHSH